jgi:MFS family permease
MKPRLVMLRHTTFASLDIPNYRLYIGGQSLSLIGTWMQMTAMSWLVLTLTHSASWLGLIVAFQTLPVLFLAPYGGVIADRVNKRKMMIFLQTLMGLQALALGLLTVTHSEHIWEIAVLAVFLGFNNAFENPSRQSFMLELVGDDHLRNAVSLNSTMVNVARMIGPAVAGLLIAGAGEGICFLINAASFVFVVQSLLRMDLTALRPVKPNPRGKGQLRAGLNYVRREPGLALPLAMMGVVGCLVYEFQVTLPYMASHGLHSNSAGYGFMTAAMAVGAVAGGLTVATRGKTGSYALILSATGFAAAMALVTVAPNMVVELIGLVFVGAASVSFMSQGNATLQLRSAPEMRGRVMALWFVAFQGSTPIGGPIVGAVMSSFGARAGLGLGAVTCVIVAVVGALTLRLLQTRRHQASADGIAAEAQAAALAMDAGQPEAEQEAGQLVAAVRS